MPRDDYEQRRELDIIFGDYGQDVFNETLITSASIPQQGDSFYVSDPYLLLKIARRLLERSKLEPTDIFQEELALGWSTNYHTILIKTKDLREGVKRYTDEGVEEKVIAELVEQANLIASKAFRQQFADNPSNITKQHAFLLVLFHDA